MYGYMTPTRLKIVVALELTDSVVRDADIVSVSAILILFWDDVMDETFRSAKQYTQHIQKLFQTLSSDSMCQETRTRTHRLSLVCRVNIGLVWRDVSMTWDVQLAVSSPRIHDICIFCGTDGVM